MRKVILVACLVVVPLTAQRVSACWGWCPPVWCPPVCCPPVCCAPCWPAGYYSSYMPVYHVPYYPVASPSYPVVAASDFRPPRPAPTPETVMTVIAPAEATVFVDGVRVPLQDGRRSFDVPELREGKPYLYRFRAEVVREGRTIIVQRQVTFRGGERVRVEFKETDLTDVSRR